MHLKCPNIKIYVNKYVSSCFRGLLYFFFGVWCVYLCSIIQVIKPKTDWNRFRVCRSALEETWPIYSSSHDLFVLGCEHNKARATTIAQWSVVTHGHCAGVRRRYWLRGGAGAAGRDVAVWFVHISRILDRKECSLPRSSQTSAPSLGANILWTTTCPKIPF